MLPKADTQNITIIPMARRGRLNLVEPGPVRAQLGSNLPIQAQPNKLPGMRIRVIPPPGRKTHMARSHRASCSRPEPINVKRAGRTRQGAEHEHVAPLLPLIDVWVRAYNLKRYPLGPALRSPLVRRHALFERANITGNTPHRGFKARHIQLNTGDTPQGFKHHSEPNTSRQRLPDGLYEFLKGIPFQRAVVVRQANVLNQPITQPKTVSRL